MWTDGNGNHGYDAYDDDLDPMDTGGHGTHCAGTIGAEGNNSIGLTGVAWKVQLMGGRFLGPEGGTTSDGIRVINDAREKEAHIISASWGGGGFSKGLYNAIKAAGDAGIPFIAAAGNSSTNNDSTPHYPSSYNLPTLVAVASTTSQDRLSYFSCYGKYSVDIAAPGSDIWSSYIGSNSSYKHLNGTSMATPHVSGAMALARAHFQDDDAEDLIARLYSSVDHIPALSGKVSTGGRLNLHKLLGASTAGVNNDDFENALRFEGDYGYWSGSNKKATREDDEDDFSLANTGNRSVWFAWKAPYKGLVEFDVEATEKPLRVIVFKGEEKDSLSLTADGGSISLTNTETVRFYSQEGQEYRILVDSSHATGQSLLVTLALKPVNDAFGGALGLSGDRFSTKGSNRNATAEAFERENPHAGVGKGKSVWWKWTPDFDGEFVITTQGSEFDTVLAVYSGSPGSLSEVEANDDRNALDWTSQVTFNVTSGTEYYIAVDGYRGDAAGGIILNGFKLGDLAIVKQPIGATVELGGRVEMNVVVLAGGQINYQWYLDDEVLLGQNTSSLVIDPVVMNSFGGYEVEVSNTAGSVRSSIAQISEKRIAPSIIFHSGNVSAVTGDYANLYVNVIGSWPLVYEWKKDGVTIASAVSDNLSFASLALSDAGEYECVVSNDVGSTSALIRVNIVQSPIDGWEWRRPGIRNEVISDMKVYDNSVYAVAGNRVLFSDNGVKWTPWKLPKGFTGQSIAKLGSTFYCLGKGYENTQVVTSQDGFIWSAPQSLSGSIDPAPYLASSQLEVIGGKLFCWLVQNNSQYGSVHSSLDGVTWQQVLKPDNSSMLTKSRMHVGGGMLKVIDYSQSSLHVTENGTVWQTHSPSGATGITAVSHFNGKHYIMGGYDIHESPDLVSWVTLPRENSYAYQWSALTVGYHLDGRFLVLHHGSLGYGRGTRLSNVEWDTLNGVGKQAITASVEFQGQILYGTENGVVDSIDDIDKLTLVDEDLTKHNKLTFLNGDFIASGTGQSWDDEDTVLTSGDGINWRKNNDVGGSIYSMHAHLNGIYFGGGWGIDSKLYTGWAPTGVKIDGPGIGAPGRIMSTATDGTKTLALGMSGLYDVDLQSWNWVKNNDPVLPVSPTYWDGVHYLNGQWFVTSNSQIFRSLDGVSWTIVPSVSARYLTYANGFYLAVDSEMRNVHKSLDGLVWNRVTPILPTGVDTSVGGGFDSVSKMLVYQGAIVVRWGTDYEGKLIFSNDGETWNVIDAPSGILDVATGLGQLIAITKNGGIVQAGGQPVGGSAPVVSIDYPANASNYIEGSQVKITGSSVDPEGSALTVECIVNGQSVGQTSEGSFEFAIEATDPSGHVVVVRAVDASGLVGAAEVLIETTPVLGANALDLNEGVSYVPTLAWLEYRGAFYATSEDALYRSQDGIKWKRVEIPAGGYKIVSLAVGNGAMVVQFSGGGLATTQDGIRWTQFKPNKGGGPIATLRFMNGYFVSGIRNSYNSQASVYFSQDGINWKTGAASQHAELRSIVITENGNIMGIYNATTVYRSVDGGDNWKKITDFGDVAPYGIAIASGAGQTVVSLKDGRVFTSSDEGKTWALSATLNVFPQELFSGFQEPAMKLSYQAGFYLLGAEKQWFYFSRDAVNWTKLKGKAVRASEVIVYGGRYIASGFNGVVWSEDGEEWADVDQGPADVIVDTLSATDRFAIVSDTNQATWISYDGLSWEKTMEGKPIPNHWDSSSTIRQVAFYKNMAISGGSSGTGGILKFSEDGGILWSPATMQDGPMPRLLSFHHHSITTGEHFVIARADKPTYYKSPSELYISEDGKNWKWLPAIRNAKIVSQAIHEEEIVALGVDGKIWKSSDRGESWDVRTLPGMLSGSAVHWFDGAWVVFLSNNENTRGEHYVSVEQENGNWSTPTSIGDMIEQYQSLDAIVANGSLYVVFSNGRLYRAEDKSLNWNSMAELTLGTYSWQKYQPIFKYDSGRFWLAIAANTNIPTQLYPSKVKYTSSDGITWDTVTEDLYLPIASNGTHYVGYGWGGGVISSDGVNWSAIPDAPTISLGGSGLHGSAELGINLLGRNGETWHSDDGNSWVQSSAEISGDLSLAVGRVMVKHKEALLVGGDHGMLAISDAAGRDWDQVKLGNVSIPDSWRINKLHSNGEAVFAAVEKYGYPSLYMLWRSNDGRSWTKVEFLKSKQIVDISSSGSEVYAVTDSGELYRSLDNGNTWGAVSGPNLTSAWGLVRYSGRWIVFGKTLDDNDGVVFSSIDGSSWISSGQTWYYNDLKPNEQFYRVAHGKLIIGRRSDIPYVTVDGLNWDAMVIRIPSGIIYNEIVEMPYGHLFVGGSQMGKLAFGETELTLIPPLQAGASSAVRIDEKLFFLGKREIVLWPEGMDITATVDPLAMSTVSVGSIQSFNLRLKNRGERSLQAGNYKINVWLSSDGFFGDDDDLLVETKTLNLGDLLPGAEVSLTLDMQIPDDVTVGESRLVVVFDPDGSVVEINKANNVYIGESPIISVAGWQLSVNAAGSGRIERDYTARFYPHGARVSLTANAGKDAAFAGWSDDLGAESQITILMDGNKSVQAKFSSRTSLQVHVRGAGDIKDLADLGSYAVGDIAVLTAEPTEGWDFSGWSGAATGNTSTANITMDANKVVTATFVKTMAKWKSEHFTTDDYTEAELDDPLITGDDADPDGDGLKNWQEYLHLSDPRDKASRGVNELKVDGGFLYAIFTRNSGIDGGLSLVCQGSRDISDWDAPDMQERVLSTDNGVETVEAKIPADGKQKGFLRLKYNRP